MKKTGLSIAVVAAFFLFTQGAVAASCPWLYSKHESVPPDEWPTPIFEPGVAGYHEIRFKGENTLSGVTVDLEWRQGAGSWNTFTTMDVTTTPQTVVLYAGSADIDFRAIYKNIGNWSNVFYWKYCID